MRFAQPEPDPWGFDEPAAETWAEAPVVRDLMRGAAQVLQVAFYRRRDRQRAAEKQHVERREQPGRQEPGGGEHLGAEIRDRAGVDIETVGIPWENHDPYVREYLIKGMNEAEAEEVTSDEIVRRVLEAARGSLAHRLLGVLAITHYARLLTELKPDVVHVLTPPQTHAAVALEAIAAGCHVLIEKPMATSLEDADAMIAAADCISETSSRRAGPSPGTPVWMV